MSVDAIASAAMFDPRLMADPANTALARGLAEPNESMPGNGPSSELRKAFDSFVGQTFYGQLLQAMRKTVDKPAYFHGGRGEEVFQAQLDQILAERMTEATADQFTGPMFELFTMHRSS